MRTRRELLAGVGVTIALAGCTGDGSEDGTTDGPASSTTEDTLTPETTTDTPTPETTTDTPTETTPEDTTTTPEDTPTETPPEDTTTTPEDTPTETPPEDTPTPEPEPEDDFAEIYTRLNRDGERDFSGVKDKLQQEGYDTDNPELTPEFIEDYSTWTIDQHGYHPETLAYGLQEEFGFGPDQVIVDSRTGNSGQQFGMTSILIKQSDGGVVKNLQYDIPDPEIGEDKPSHLRANETPDTTGEQVLADAWNEEEIGATTWLNRSWLATALESDDHSDYITDKGQEHVSGGHDDLAIGDNDYEDGGRLAFTEDAFKEVSQIIDPSEINSDPNGTGLEAWDLLREVTTFYHNHEDEYIEVDFDGEKFQYDTVNESRHEELVDGIFEEYKE